MFNDIIGNDENKELLKNIIDSKKISHSYMFSGKQSIGKYMFALEFAKGVLCISDNKPCGMCKSCIELENLNNPDFNIINPEGNSIKIEQIRQMNKKILEKPIVSDRKVYLINDSHLMTKEAQNSLLKTLEEPPEYSLIILISSNDNMFLTTIKSRCIKISFNKLSDEELKRILEQKSECNNISENVLKIADGSVKKVIEIIDKQDEYIEVEEIFTNLDKISLIDMINSKESIFKDKENVYNILEYINLLFFDLVKINVGADDPVCPNKYIKCMEILESTKDRLNKNSNYDMTVDRFLIKSWEIINK